MGGIRHDNQCVCCGLDWFEEWHVTWSSSKKKHAYSPCLLRGLFNHSKNCKKMSTLIRRENTLVRMAPWPRNDERGTTRSEGERKTPGIASVGGVKLHN